MNGPIRVLGGLLMFGSTAAVSTAADSTPNWPQPVRAPAGAPSVLLIMTDDVGFGASSTFGGPVPTPTLDRLARTGVRYNRFHTVGICSPTRASLLTGRQHTAVAMGNVTNAATGFEGYTSVLPASAATVARILRDRGFGTAMFGKSHLVPPWETGPAGPFDRWPTGLGFQYFYGFLDGDTSQFVPAVYRNTLPVEAPAHQPGYHLDEDLADDAIRWMRQQRAAAPQRPLFVYFAPGTAHAPLHAPRDWIARFKGRFDAGWDVERAATLRRQIELGVVPRGTRLSARPEAIPAWRSLTDRQRRVYARGMEVYAAALAHADHQVGRVIDAARDLLGKELLVIYVQGDNGASAEGGLDGSLNEHAVLNGIQEPLEDMDRRLDETGGPGTYPQYSIGWAHAMNAPFPWVKQLPSHLGAVRNGLVIDWPGRTRESGTVRAQFAHVVDIAPTILEAAGIAWPATVDGVAQQAVDGLSLLPTLSDAAATEHRPLQFFSLWDNMGIYHDGWWAGSWPQYMPWTFGVSQPTKIEGRRWQLFDLSRDFSQSRDLADARPDKLAELQALFWREAERARALPIHREEGRLGRPSNYAGMTRLHFVGPQTRLHEEAAPRLLNRSFTMTARVHVPAAGAAGVIFAQGGQFGGMSWFLHQGRLALHYNYGGLEQTEIMATASVSAGERELQLVFELADPMRGPATVVLSVDGSAVATGVVNRTVPFRLSLDETFDVGSDTGTAVSARYPAPFTFNGQLQDLVIDFASRRN